MGIDPKEITKFASDLQKAVADVEARIAAIAASQARIEKALADLTPKEIVK